MKKVADPLLMPLRREEKDAGLGTGNGQFDPAPFPDRAIGRNDEAHDFRPEGKRAVLIARRDADVIQLSDHG
ncbi:MAG: hypothetical protein PGN16_11860 [Sphingomonas phyllosphaerae]